MKLPRHFARLFLLCSAAIIPAALAAETPRAVSAPNLTLSVGGGTLQGESAGIISATASAPVGNQYGVQLDALYADADGDSAGFGGHFFYRDPTRYLLGVTAMTAKTSGTDFNRFGLESELYLNNYSVAVSGGLQDGDNKLGDSAFYRAEGAYYYTDNLKFTAGTSGFDDVIGGYGEAEWQPRKEPMTLFALAGGANEGHGYALAGVRYTFGASATTSIKHRDRTGDPENIVKNAINYTGSAIEQLGNVVTGGGGFNRMSSGR